MRQLGIVVERVQIMISHVAPLAADVAAWISTHRWQVIVAAVAATPAIAILQGAYFLARYRIQYGESPVPLLPAHGVVVVDPGAADGAPTSDNDTDDASFHNDIGPLEELGGRVPPLFPLRLQDKAYRPIEITYRNGSRGDSNALANRKRIWGSLSSSKINNIDPVERLRQRRDAPALRLLVIGDSLAAGVGVLSSCSPLLPEVIAKALSKSLGGRPVYWTCVAEPGASSGWIVRELDKFQNDELSSSSSSERISRGFDVDLVSAKEGSSSFHSGHNDSLSPSSASSHTELTKDSTCNDMVDVDEDGELNEWCSRLATHSKRLKSEVLGEYDVCLVMTGLNDLKGAVLPFLLQGDEIKFRQEAHQRGGDYAAELKRVVDAVSTKMKDGLRESLKYVDNIRGKFVSMASFQRVSAEEVERDETEDPLQFNADISFKRHPRRSYDTLSSTKSDQRDGQYPLVVLTALPSNLPVLQWPTFIWCLIPLIRWTDRIKRRLADKYSRAVLFVGAPSHEVMKEYESGQGKHWLGLRDENVLLSLKIGAAEECLRISESMQLYFRKHAKIEAETDLTEGYRLFCKKRRSYENLFDRNGIVIYPANVRPTAEGASLLSADGIHPNDAGYDLWGRIIADEILKKWKMKPSPS
mmetsp:Transcript_9283/g.19855  ORF Transcript_9283/g.19855 Transcript_9283/m.19855 type:complete len:642 (-) Transcript_9283:1466-3391(-)